MAVPQPNPNFGRFLRVARRTVDITQQTLADRLGVKRQAVAAWEADLDRPTPEHFASLLLALPILADILKIRATGTMGRPAGKHDDVERPEPAR